MLISFVVTEICSTQNFSMKTTTKGNTSKIRKWMVMVLGAVHVHSLRYIYLYNFMLISFVVTKICSTQNVSMKKAITLKLGSGWLWFLYSTLPLINVYLPIKFHADIFCSH